MTSLKTAQDGSGPPRDAAAAHVRAVAEESGSSFYWAMRLLPRPRREAMFAIYAFCREVDDIADGVLPIAEKRARLSEWRDEIAALYAGTPDTLTGRALGDAVEAFGLAREDLYAIVDGMEMDATGAMVAPDTATLMRYCHNVAGAVGLLSIRVFGDASPPAREFANALGNALQLTNILRDLAEDAAMGRLYLPRELLHKHGILERSPREVLLHPARSAVCQELAGEAEAWFAAAEAALSRCDSAALRPAVAMKESYRRLLARLAARGWQRLDERVRISRREKLWIALRNYVG